ENTALGVFALSVNQIGWENTAVGAGALYSLYDNGNIDSASFNTAIGAEALGNLTTGSSYNIAVGYNAGGNLVTGTNNIYIGNVGNATESGITRIGTPGTQTATYLSGKVGFDGGLNLDNSGTFGQNTGNVISNALTFGTGGGGSGEGIASKRVGTNPFDLEFYTAFLNRMTILSSGYVGMGTTNPAYPLEMGSGAYCSVAGAWTSVSDRNVKEDFTAIKPAEVLAKVAALPITQWKYKVEADGTEHLGPMAQDFHAAFGLNGADDKHISTVDEGGVALAAIQGLNQKVEEKNSEIQTLKHQNDSLTERLNQLEATVKQLAANK